jgi:hypothetical protein
MNKHYNMDAMKTKRLLICGVISGPFFVITFLIEGLTRLNYNWLRHPVSSLALGDFGWVQVANFIITGLLTLTYAVGLWRALRTPGGSTWGPLLVGLFAIGLLGAGIFLTDPVSGYPPGTPDLHLVYSSNSARLHDLFGIPVFIGLPLACFVFCRWFARLGERGWAIYSVVSGFTMLASFILASMGFAQAEGLADFGGLFQRISIIIGFGWLTLLAIHLLRAPSKIVKREV